MFEFLANSGDPTQLAGIIHPGDYPGRTYVGIFRYLAAVYLIPFALTAVATWVALFLKRKKPALPLSSVIVLLAPPVVWLILVYADPTFKGPANLLELSFLGVASGLVIGLGGRYLRSVVNGISAVWLLCVVATGMYLYLPAYPTHIQSIEEISSRYR